MTLALLIVLAAVIGAILCDFANVLRGPRQ